MEKKAKGLAVESYIMGFLYQDPFISGLRGQMIMIADAAPSLPPLASQAAGITDAIDTP